jgi:hypothetical protein
MPNHPTPHPAPARFDVPETLQVLSSEMEVEGLASPRAQNRPAFAEHFPAIIRSTGCASDQFADYPDARYYLDRAVPGAGASQTTELSARPDTLPGVGGCLTATNLAELPQNTHLLPTATLVHAFGLSTRTGGKVYFFNHPPATTAVVQITAAASGGGKYTGHLVSGASTAPSSGTLAMPEGLAAGANVLILNEEEDGQSGHRLAIPGYAVGKVVGIVGGQAIVMIRGAVGATSGPTSIAGSGVSPDTGAWSRAANATPVNVTVQTRTVWDSSAGVLYAYQRTMSFDARGALYAISAEGQVTVDSAIPCT